MRLISVQGHFGNLNGMKIEFPEGFSRLNLPSGGGKTTICALIRVMLYGLNAADREKYLPQNGKPMSGRMELDWNGRHLVIVRETGEDVFDFRVKIINKRKEERQ